MQAPMEKQIKRAKEIAYYTKRYPDGTKMPVNRPFIVVDEYTLCLTPDEYEFTGNMFIDLFVGYGYIGKYPISDFMQILWAIVDTPRTFADVAQHEVNKAGMREFTKALHGRFNVIVKKLYQYWDENELPDFVLAQQFMNNNDMESFLKIIGDE